MMMMMRTFMGSSRIKLCRVQSVVAAKEKCYSLSTLLSPSGSIVPLKGTREQLDKRLPLTKIVATIGPASEHLPALSHVVDAGMRIMRINFSHATYDEADLRMRNLSACAVIDHTADAGQVHMRAVMLDTQGPEIRTGSFSSGTKEVLLKEGDLVTLTTDESVRQQQTSSHIWISYRKLYDTVSLGSSILLDDGIVELKVESKGSNGTEVTCRVMNSGVVGNKKGVNMPGLPVELPAMSDKDKLDIRWGIQNNIDYIAASFVRKASDVTEIRDYCRELIRELYPIEEGGRQLSPPVPIPSIISKIESVEALINFESILQTSDAIMVARGDLAVEIPMETLANVQKEMVRRCNAAGKPVIVATQMLESMQKNPRPTRAECTDVANAVIDGADCVMLSGESAKGKYPVESVAIMNSIVHQAELGLLESEPSVARGTPAISDPLEAMAYSVVQAATSHRANPRFNCIVVMHSSSPSSTSTDLARLISKHRPHVPIVTIVPDYKSGRLLQVHKGIHPVLMLLDTDRVEVPQTLQYLRQLGIVRGSDQVLVVGQQSSGSAITVSLTSA